MYIFSLQMYTILMFLYDVRINENIIDLIPWNWSFD